MSAGPAGSAESRLLVIAGEVGRVRAVLDLFDAGQRDCTATLGDLRASVDRIADTLRAGWSA